MPEQRETVRVTPGADAPRFRLGRLLVRNTLSNFAGQTFLMALTFFATPYIIHHFGSIRYGVLVLLLAFISLMNLFQLGMNSGLVKYLAEDFGRADTEDSALLVETGLTLYLLVGITVAVILAALARWSVSRFFHVPPELQRDAILGFYLVSAAFLVRFVADVFDAVPIAAQRFDIVNGLFVGGECVRILGSVAVVYFGYLIKAVIATTLFANLLFLVGSIFSAKYLISGLNLRPQMSREHFHKLFHFSKFAAIAQVASRVANSIDGLIIAHFLPVAYVAFYSVPAALCYKVWALVANVTTVTFPAASALSAADHTDKLKELYLRGSKMVFALAALPALALCLLSGEVLRYWISPEFSAEGSVTLKLLSIASLINCLMHIPDSVSMGIGHSWIPAKFDLLHLALKIGIFLMLIPYFGITGAAAGYLGTQLAVAPWFVRSTNQVVGVGWNDLLVRAYSPVLAPLGVTSLVIVLAKPHISSVFRLLVAGGLALVIYVAMGALFTLDSQERSACLNLLGKRFSGAIPPRESQALSGDGR